LKVKNVLFVIIPTNLIVIVITVMTMVMTVT